MGEAAQGETGEWQASGDSKQEALSLGQGDTAEMPTAVLGSKIGNSLNNYSTIMENKVGNYVKENNTCILSLLASKIYRKLTKR